MSIYRNSAKQVFYRDGVKTVGYRDGAKVWGGDTVAPYWSLVNDGTSDRFDTPVTMENVRGGWVSEDGWDMIIQDEVINQVKNSAMSVGWNMNTLTNNNTNNGVGKGHGFGFSRDGLRMYVSIATAINDAKIEQRDLIGAFNTKDNVLTTTLDINAASDGCNNIATSADGTKLWVTSSNNRVLQYSLPTPTELAGATLDGFLSLPYRPISIFVRADEKQLFIASTSDIYSYSMDTNDILGAVELEEATVSSSVIRGISLKPDGRKLFAFSDGGTFGFIYEIILTGQN